MEDCVGIKKSRLVPYLLVEEKQRRGYNRVFISKNRKTKNPLCDFNICQMQSQLGLTKHRYEQSQLK